MKKLQYLKKEQEKAYHLVHEGDPLSKDDKNKKSYRNTEFADFLVNTFGLENLKKGKLLHVRKEFKTNDSFIALR